jgi:exportin-1
MWAYVAHAKRALSAAFCLTRGARVTWCQLVEGPESTEVFEIGHQYLLLISDVDDREMFKITLEYWNKLVRAAPPLSCMIGRTRWLTAWFMHGRGGCVGRCVGQVEDLYRTPFPTMVLMTETANAGNLRRAKYAPVLSRLRLIMIEHMAKPEEVPWQALVGEGSA